MQEGEKPEAPMARDEIEEAFRRYWETAPASDLWPALAFRAGAEWALRRAVGVCKGFVASEDAAPEGSALAAVYDDVLSRLASALASLSPAPPRPETKRGEG